MRDNQTDTPPESLAVQTLQRMLQAAREGKIRAVFVVGVMPNGGYARAWDDVGQGLALAGAVAMAAREHAESFGDDDHSRTGLLNILH